MSARGPDWFLRKVIVPSFLGLLLVLVAGVPFLIYAERHSPVCVNWSQP